MVTKWGFMSAYHATVGFMLEVTKWSKDKTMINIFLFTHSNEKRLLMWAQDTEVEEPGFEILSWGLELGWITFNQKAV